MLRFSKRLQESNKIGNESQRARVVFTLAFLEGGTLKKIKIKFCSVIVCIALVFQVTLNNNNDCYYDYETEATGLEVPVAYGIWEIIMGLLLSAGVVYTVDSAVEDDWLDVNTEEYEEQGELYLYLKRAYNANLKVIEGTGDGGQEPSESPSPSPSPSPSEDNNLGRDWDVLVSSAATNGIIEFTESEWKAWKITVETFINDAFGHGADYNILQVDADAASKFQKAKELACEKYNIDFKYSTYRAIVPGNAWYDAYEYDENIYYVYLFPENCYYTLSEDKTASGYPSYNVVFNNANVFHYCLVTYWDEWDGESATENISFYDQIVRSKYQTILRLEYESPYYCINMPYMIPDIAPYIGDRPSEDTITTVPEIQPDPDSEEENKPYVIPDGMPQPMKLPASDDIQKLYENIQDNPDGAQDAVKTLQQDLMSQAETDSDPIEPTPAPSTSPDSDFSSKAGNYMYDFSDLFPFCIPKDFYNLLCVFNAEAEAPKFEIPFDIDYGDIQYHEVFILDMSDFESVVKIFRLLCIVSFILMLIWVTRNFIKW